MKMSGQLHTVFTLHTEGWVGLRVSSGKKKNLGSCQESKSVYLFRKLLHYWATPAPSVSYKSI
jgi:hypothetical protein